MSFLLGGVIVLVLQGLPFQEFFLTGKILAGQADDDFIGIHINEGIGVFLIQRIAAFSIKHFVPPFGVGWLVSQANTGGERQPTEKRKKAR